MRMQVEIKSVKVDALKDAKVCVSMPNKVEVFKSNY